MSDAFRDFEQQGWSDTAVALSYHRQVAEVTQGCIPELIRSSGLKAGDKVLDVACGAGYVASAARDRGADATGVDFSAVQVQLAKQTSPNIRFVEGDAEALPFPDGEFDVVLNAFGMPHVPNADKAVAEAFRVLRLGGAFAYASWCEAAKCIGFSVVYDAIRIHGSLDVGLPPGPNFFGYGDQKFATELLGRAGFVAVSSVEVPLLWRVSDPNGLFDAIASGSVRAGAVLRRQKPQDLAKIKQFMHDRVAEFARDGGYAVPAAALVVTARKLS